MDSVVKDVPVPNDDPPVEEEPGAITIAALPSVEGGEADAIADGAIGRQKWKHTFLAPE